MKRFVYHSGRASAFRIFCKSCESVSQSLACFTCYNKEKINEGYIAFNAAPRGFFLSNIFIAAACVCMLYCSTDCFSSSFISAIQLCTFICSLAFVTSKLGNFCACTYGFGCVFFSASTYVCMLNSCVCRYGHECNYVCCSKFSSAHCCCCCCCCFGCSNLLRFSNASITFKLYFYTKFEAKIKPNSTVVLALHSVKFTAHSN